MFRMSSTKFVGPEEVKGTIRVKHPIRSLGTIIDVTGQKWDIRAISSGGVAAVKIEELHRYYTDTSGPSSNYGGMGTQGSNLVSQEWDAYKVEVVT